MRDPSQQFDAEPGIAIASPQTADEIMVRIRSLTAAYAPLIARLALKSDDPADTARILIDCEVSAIRFHTERLLRF